MTHSPLIPGFNWDFQNSCGYGTHQPVLYEAIKYTSDIPHPILELGCGNFSTDLIHAMAYGKRNIISLDHNKAWIDKFGSVEGHEFKCVSYEEMKMPGAFSVVFVDQGDWQSRADCIKHYRHMAYLVVLHDSDYLERELGINFGNHYQYYKTFMPLQPYPYVTGPPTTIMSNVIDVTKWNINYEDYQ